MQGHHENQTRRPLAFAKTLLMPLSKYSAPCRKMRRLQLMEGALKCPRTARQPELIG